MVASGCYLCGKMYCEKLQCESDKDFERMLSRMEFVMAREWGGKVVLIIS